MKAIRKYKLNTEQLDNDLVLKWGYRFVHSEYVMIDKALYLWVEEPLAAATPSVSVRVKVAKSGDPLPDSCRHVYTAIDSYAPEAYHVFVDTSIDQSAHKKVSASNDSNAA